MSKKSVLVISTIQRDEIEIGLFNSEADPVACHGVSGRLPFDKVSAPPTTIYGSSSPIQVSGYSASANKTKRFKCKTQDQSNDLLKTIEDVLKKEKILLRNLTAVLVNISPGSYTGVRVGATVANTLAWSLNIPVLGYQDIDFEKTLQIAKNTTLKFSKLALPTYLDTH